MKRFRRSPVAVACYILAAAFAAYFVTIVASTIVTINQYYAQYDMSASVSEVVGYLFQNALSPLTAVITTFMAGLIYDEVRKLNPDNWATDEEIAEAKEAKRLAKEAKQIAKGEAAVAAAEAAEGNSDTTEGIKPEFAAVIAEDAEELADEVVAETAEETEAPAEETAEETEAPAEEAAEETEAPAEEAADEIVEEEEEAGEEEEAEPSSEPVHTEFFADVAEEAEKTVEQ